MTEERFIIASGTYGTVWSDPRNPENAVKTFGNITSHLPESFVREMAIASYLNTKGSCFTLPVSFTNVAIGPKVLTALELRESAISSVDTRSSASGSVEPDTERLGPAQEKSSQSDEEKLQLNPTPTKEVSNSCPRSFPGFYTARCSGDVRNLFLLNSIDSSGKSVPRIASLSDVARVLFCCHNSLNTAHRLGICHRDVKPDNVMVDLDPHGRVVEAFLWDWGMGKPRMSVLSPDVRLTGAVMATQFRPPELLDPQGYREAGKFDGQHFTESLDLWGLGMIAVTMLFRETPDAPAAAYVTAHSRVNVENAASSKLLSAF
eukprot:CAMPEP_0175095594 /NCGR_PEP_ID=MMETSP0086_2-20121207/4248_1 /TAXON_ID=136419 /ORGANISM="Unknown Unknown, Strain D1" /LENGTH=318 /DNA_ID=CAMNT_0016368871 /DNA_START=88 /DNA_END=1045 /DNA_ORIENTATION=-